MNVLFLTTLPTLNACNSSYDIISNVFFCFTFLGSYVFISDQKVKAESNRIEIAFLFHFVENPKGHTLDHFFYASHIRHNFPYKLIPISMS